jgi:hypothetical protein
MDVSEILVVENADRAYSPTYLHCPNDTKHAMGAFLFSPFLHSAN